MRFSGNRPNKLINYASAIRVSGGPASRAGNLKCYARSMFSMSTNTI